MKWGAVCVGILMRMVMCMESELCLGGMADVVCFVWRSFGVHGSADSVWHVGEWTIIVYVPFLLYGCSTV